MSTLITLSKTTTIANVKNRRPCRNNKAMNKLIQVCSNIRSLRWLSRHFVAVVAVVFDCNNAVCLYAHLRHDECGRTG